VFGGLVFFGFTGSGVSAVLPCWFSSTSSLLSFNSADFSGSICCSCGSETFFCRSGVFALDVLFSSSYGAATSPAAVVRPVSSLSDVFCLSCFVS
jgi:hypothetical protein